MTKNLEKLRLRKPLLSAQEERAVEEILTKIDIFELGEKPLKKVSERPRHSRTISTSEKTYSI